MAKKPESPKPETSKVESAPSSSPRDRAIDALMSLAALEPWNAITLPMIAGEAGLSLADLRDAFPSKGAILGGFAKRVDRIVLDGTGADMAVEPVRERVLDVMLRRFDALTPYKAALKSIRDGVKRDPLALAALNQLALNSWRYMLAAADVDTEDHLGTIKVQGAALVFGRAMETWFGEEEADLARTMAVLDRELKRGETILGRAEDIHRLTAPFRGFFRAAAESRQAARDRRRSRDVAPPTDYAA